MTESKNGTFLFMRDYMEYHADRFVDTSLVIGDARNRIVALLPANRDGDVVTSHAGLTYGGFVTSASMTQAKMLHVFAVTLRYLAEQGCTRLIYKTIPHIFHRCPADEDSYALFRAHAELFRRDVLTVIDYQHPLKPRKGRAWGIRKATNQGVAIGETEDYEQFWLILSQNLHQRYGVLPVHTCDEIRLLASRFPDAIRLFAAYRGAVMLAGAVVYLTPTVCHVQYNAVSEEGKSVAALDLLLYHLIERYRASRRFFDFGVSTSQDGVCLNPGLLRYKEGFGARTVVHDFYAIDVAGWDEAGDHD